MVVYNLILNIIDDVAPSITPLTPQCYNGTPITVPVVASVFAGSSITYAKGTGVPGVAVAEAYSQYPNVSFPGPGSYTIFVKDDNGCIATAPYVIRDEISLDLKIKTSFQPIPVCLRPLRVRALRFTI